MPAEKCNIAGCGVDIEELDRFNKFIPTHSDIPELTKLVYSDDEIRINRAIQPHLTFPLAFSCKEAFFKAFGVSWTNSPISWKDIELIFSEPTNLRDHEVRLSGHALELFRTMQCTHFETSIDFNERFVVFQVLLFSNHNPEIKTSVFFPAFVNEYNGAELTTVRAYGDGFDRLLGEASDILKTDLTAFDPIGNNFLEDELKSQYISYVYSCAVSDILKQQGITSSFVSGYSMGIYAALYHCGAYGFGQGLSLVKKAWELIVETCGNHEYAMGMIIGLEEKEIQEWCKGTEDAWICNRNNPHTFIVSGNSASIKRILDLSREEGALKANLLPVSRPYHTPLLKAAGEHFGQYLETLPIADASLAYVSCIDQKVVRTGQEVRNELMRNIYCRMNWFETMNFLVGQGSELFFECGAGDGLTKNFRFIEGEFKALPAYRLTKMLDETRR